MLDDTFWPPPEAFLDLSSVKQLTDGRARCVGVAVCDDDGHPTLTFRQGQRAHFFYEFAVLGEIGVPSGGLEFHNSDGHIIHGKNTFQYGTPAPRIVRPGEHLRYHHILELDVFPNIYYFTVGLASADEQSFQGYVSGPLKHEEFASRTREHCRAVDAGWFTIDLSPEGKLRYHGAVNLPGDCRVNVIKETTAAPALALMDTGDGDSDKQPTIFHVTHWKAGSQWIYSILKDCVLDQIVAPEVDEVQFRVKPIRAGGVYPTVYVTKRQFDRANLPPNWRRFVVIRDLRDTLISGYFSIKVSHPLITDDLKHWRAMLHKMSLAEGLIYLMDEWLPASVVIQRSWLDAGEQFIRYEDLLEHDLEILESVLLDKCGLPVSRERFRKAVLKNRFENFTNRPRGHEDLVAHERKGIAGDWRNHFDDQVKEAFKARYGDLLIASGYEQDNDW